MTTTRTKTLWTTAKAPDSRGSFEGLIFHDPPGGDSDGERIPNFTNVPTAVPLGYTHVSHDPGAIIGTAHARSRGDGHLLVSGKLNLSNSMARAVHERMLLPSTDAMSLRELSVGFSFDTSRAFKDTRGVRVLPDARLEEISIVFKGAQQTLKSSSIDSELATLSAQLDDLEIRRATKTAPDLVDRFVAQDRELRRREREEAARWTAAIARTSVPPGTLLPSEAERDERDRERFAREQAERDRRDAEKEREAAERDRVDAARRGGDVQVIS
jgi:hypothetical protein